MIDLDTTIDTYWYKYADLDFSKCSKDWNSYVKEDFFEDVRKYAKNYKLVQNPATLLNCLTHSSTIKNGYMQWSNSKLHTGEFFEGSMGKSYYMATFLLAHTADQLFNKGVPGAKTEYNKDKDSLTREHALAGFTMQVAMKKTINEYLQSEILSPLGINNSSFKEGNSIYFAAGYQSSAVDFAKIVALVANDGIYEGRQILNSSTIQEIEKIYPHLKNQSIAFSYDNNLFIRYGKFSSLSYAYRYQLSDLSNYYSYASYNPDTKNGLVITTFGDSNKAKSLIDSIESYVYSIF